MRSAFWLILAALLLIPISARAQDAGVVGTYRLFFSGDASWHQNELVILSSSGVVRGKVSVDFGIGPMDRSPQPWETLQTVPFVARWDKSGAMHFTARFATAAYAFELYPVRDRLVGVVTVQGTRRDGPRRAEPWRMGVLARKHVSGGT